MKKILSLCGLLLLLAGCGAGATRAATGGDAASTATGTALGTTTSALSTAAGSGLSSALALNLSRIPTLKAVTETINESFSESAQCGSGSGSMTGTVSGTAEVSAGSVSSVNIDVTMSGTFTNCAPPDDSSTSDFDESTVTLSGTMDGSGSVVIASNKLSMDMTMNGSLTMGGTGCPDGGTMSMMFETSGTADIPTRQGQEPTFACTMSGSVSGTVCGTAINCTMSGDCDNPSISGDNCS